MSSVVDAAQPSDRLLGLRAFADEFEAWLDDHRQVVRAAQAPIPDYGTRVTTMAQLMSALHEAGWSRYGWPTEVGGCGGSLAHRAVMWEALARHGVAGMALFEHLEILAPTLVAHGPTAFVADALPAFLAGRELWAQGFSEPDAGSDLASLRTRAVPDGDGFVITGRKIWTSWARYATWCLVLARTGPTESRHRGLTAFIVDLRSPGVEVSAIEQANGTDELAEVAFDGVYVGADRIVGQLDGGWAIAMHILSHERGTFAWFRHCFLYQHLRVAAAQSGGRDDRALGEALLDLSVVTATAHAGVVAHSTGVTLGPKAAYTKLLLCVSEQAVNDCVLDGEPDLAVGSQTPEVALQRQDYLFSRIVTVYGGSQQMQLNTIAKQILQQPIRFDHDGSDDEFLTAACRAVRASVGSAGLETLGWWQLLAHLADAETRAAVFATFRAQGRELGNSAALGGLLAQPFIDRTAIASGTVVAAVRRQSRRRGTVWVTLGDIEGRMLLFDEPGRGAYLIDADAVELHPVDVPGRAVIQEISVDLDRHQPWLTDELAHPARARSIYLGRIAAASEILGTIERAVDLSVEHAANREQFGQPIGDFQAVRHLLAWAKTDCLALDSILREAIFLFDDAPARYDEVVKAFAGRNGRRACERSLQVLGAIGFTAEHPHHHHHSRALLLDSLLGSSTELSHDLGAWLRVTGAEPGFARAVLPYR